MPDPTAPATTPDPAAPAPEPATKPAGTLAERYAEKFGADPPPHGEYLKDEVAKLMEHALDKGKPVTQAQIRWISDNPGKEVPVEVLDAVEAPLADTKPPPLP